MSGRQCNRCLRHLPADKFHKDSRRPDGLFSFCKQCVREIRSNDDFRAANKRRSAAHRARDPQARRDAVRKWYNNNTERVKAHSSVYRAVKAGRLTRPENCSRCGKSSAVHAHHTDYSKPLDVQWLCPSCHKGLHSAGQSL